MRSNAWEEEKKNEPKGRAFDIEKEAKKWDDIDLGAMMMANNQKNNKIEAKRVEVTVKPSELVRIKNDINLRLTQDIEFSMTQFAKPNKGFTNVQRVNCFMNVCLQSLLACPAMFNLLQAVKLSSEI